jgi:hypothetical protein
MITEEMRSVLETLARTFTNRDDLSVMWDINPCTDFNKIYLRPDEAIVPGVECPPGELWLSQKAVNISDYPHLIPSFNSWARSTTRLKFFAFLPESLRIFLAVA